MNKILIIILTIALVACHPNKDKIFTCTIDITYTNSDTETLIMKFVPNFDFNSQSNEDPFYLSDGCLVNKALNYKTIRCGVRQFRLVELQIKERSK